METPIHIKIAGWAVILAVGSIVALWTVVFLIFWAIGKVLLALVRSDFWQLGGGVALAFGGGVWLALRGFR